MINTLIVNEPGGEKSPLLEIVNTICLQVQVCACAHSLDNAYAYIKSKKPKLVLLDIEPPCLQGFTLIQQFPSLTFETIILSGCIEKAYPAIQHGAVGFVLKPLRKEALLLAVRQAVKRIEQRAPHKEPTPVSGACLKELIGVPTIEGLEFISVSDIVRCEGLQKYTRVITRDGAEIISSYNIGEFKKLLEPCGFHAPHKSHLVNLRHIRQFHKDGTIRMNDLSCVPVSRRRKAEFLGRIMHL